jgi:hypothetical protein
MALQVCEYPECKKLTLTKRCHAHPLDGFEDDETEPLTPEPTKRSSEELAASIMNVVAQHPAGQKKETTMMPNTLCSKKLCGELKAEDSVMCPHHRDIKKRSNDKYQGRPVETTPIYKPRRKYTFHTRQPKASTPASAQLPAKRSTAPITLAEPRIVNSTPTRSVDLNGNAVTVLDSFIGKLQADLVTLQGAKEILEGWRG